MKQLPFKWRSFPRTLWKGRIHSVCDAYSARKFAWNPPSSLFWICVLRLSLYCLSHKLFVPNLHVNLREWSVSRLSSHCLTHLLGLQICAKTTLFRLMFGQSLKAVLVLFVKKRLTPLTVTLFVRTLTHPPKKTWADWIALNLSKFCQLAQRCKR